MNETLRTGLEPPRSHNLPCFCVKATVKAEHARLDIFNCVCLLRICGMPHSNVSRVSNDDVLRRSGQPRLSFLLAVRQAKLYRRIRAHPTTSIVKSAVCIGHGQPIIWCLHRKRGRPRQVWVAQVYRMSQENTFGMTASS